MLASQILSAGPDAPLAVSPDVPWIRSPVDCLNYYRMDLSIAEGQYTSKKILAQLILGKAANCGPLSLAAISGNEHTVSDLLDRYPTTCREVNIFGQTPIQLAVLHPSCLRLIVKKSERSILDKRDKMEDRALDYAARVGCEESVAILIEHQCSIDLSCLQYPLASCMGVIISGLRKRRDRLKTFAVKHLSEVEITRLNLGNYNTLDRNTKEVQQILYDRGIMSPDGIDGLETSDYGFSTYTSVYHTRADIKLFGVLWEHKFRDIDSLDLRGKPPLLIEPWDSDFEVEACYTRYRWLTEHGADLWTPFSIKTTTGKIKDPVTPAHFLFATIGAWWDADFEYEPPNIEVVRFLTKELLAVYVSDDCSCHCTSAGCTPLALFLRCLTRDSYGAGRLSWPRRLENPQALASPLVRFIQEAQPNFTMEQHLAVVKYMTHAALGIAHTCCRFTITHHYESRHLPPEEVEEINSEQTYLLELLDDLVVEFEQISRDDRNGLPLGLGDPEEFWICRWVDRMNAVLEELDGDNVEEKERADANAIGVVWDTMSATSSKSEIKLEQTPEYFLGRLEEIMKNSQ